MLFNPVFADYMQAYGRGGIKAHELGAIEMLARLYWYTVEFGLIDTPEGIRTYGAGILSSGGEIGYCIDSPNPNRIGFDLLRIMQTRYKIDTYQETYFVIRDFGQLFDATAPDFTPYYEQLVDGGSRGSAVSRPRENVLSGVTPVVIVFAKGAWGRCPADAVCTFALGPGSSGGGGDRRSAHARAKASSISARRFTGLGLDGSMRASSASSVASG